MNKNLKKVYIFISPFLRKQSIPRRNIFGNNGEFSLNPLGRKMTEEELINTLGETLALVAGMGIIFKRVFETRPRLKHISRVGIGLDSVDLLSGKRRYFGFLHPRWTSFGRGGTCHRSDAFTSLKDRPIQPHDALGTIEPLHGAPDLQNHYWHHGCGRDRGKSASAAKGLWCPQGPRQ